MNQIFHFFFKWYIFLKIKSRLIFICFELLDVFLSFIDIVPDFIVNAILHGWHVFLVKFFSCFESKKSPELRSVEFTVTVCGKLPATVNYIKFGLSLFQQFWPEKNHYNRKVNFCFCVCVCFTFLN